MKNKGFDLILTDGYVVAEMLKLPEAGKEVGVVLAGQRIKIFCIGSTQSLDVYICVRC